MKTDEIDNATDNEEDDGRIYVKELIDWNEQIEPYKATLLLVGCGSGKTSLIDSLVKGKLPNVSQRPVLVVTSRQAKRMETLYSNEEYCGYIRISGNVWMDLLSYILYQQYNMITSEYNNCYERDGSIIQDACVIPAQISNFLISASLKDRKELNDCVDKIWKQYDTIVIDEIHSIVSDSGFMTSQARIAELIKAFATRCTDPKKHMLFMTGTGDVIEPILKKWIPEINVINYMKEAYSVVPKNIRFTPSDSVKREQELLFQNNIKFIYFYNGKARYLSEYCAGTLLDEKRGMSLFTNPEMRKNLAKANKSEYDRMIEVEEYLAKNQRLPDGIDFLISTSRGREAMSINNEDFLYMYVDSHIPSDVIQYSGRLRKAEYTLTIVDGTYQYCDKSLEEMEALQQRDIDCLDNLNDLLDSIQTNDERMALIQSVENSHWFVDGQKILNPEYKPYLFFNPFTFRFEFNELKAINERYVLECVINWGRLNRYKKTSFSSYVRKWFVKKVNITNYETKEWRSCEILRSGGFVTNKNEASAKKHYYTDDKIEALKKALAPIWGEFANINTYLRRFNKTIEFKKIRSGKHAGQWELVKTH